jgi:RHS repeat-associated protein
MTYDDWGRLDGRDDGTHTATYDYRYGSKLYSVASDFPGEGSVIYETGGDQKRRSRVAGLDETWYNYTVGFDVVSTESDAGGSTGTLTMTNVVRRPRAPVSTTLADLVGTTPSSGTARYYAIDRLRSTSSTWNASKLEIGGYEYTPYGGKYAHSGAALASLAAAFTGKRWDDDVQLYQFPYRDYSPGMVRWTARDPLGMIDGPNMYSYVGGNPVLTIDRLGLSIIGAICRWLGWCKPDTTIDDQIDNVGGVVEDAVIETVTEKLPLPPGFTEFAGAGEAATGLNEAYLRNKDKLGKLGADCDLMTGEIPGTVGGQLPTETDSWGGRY